MTGPSWASSSPSGTGTPLEGSALDQQMAAFVGPRWGYYRRKFAPFFDDPRFQPTWNWAAALTLPLGGLWFLYRKLYVPFAFFMLAPGLAFGLLWGDAPLFRPPNPSAPDAPAFPYVPEAMPLLVGVILSTVILGGGTANFLLFRRATAAIQIVAPRHAEVGAQLPALTRIGGVSRVSVAVGLILWLVISLLRSSGVR